MLYDFRRIVQYTVQDGRTALMCAADIGYADCVRMLLDAGADKEAKDNVRYQYCNLWEGCVSVHVCHCFGCLLFSKRMYVLLISLFKRA